MDSVNPKVLTPGRYAIDVEPIPPHNRNNREVYLDYLKHLKESVETLCEIVEEANVERPLDRSLASACRYTKHSQELLEYVIGTCLKDFNKQDKKHASTPLTKKRQVTFKDQYTKVETNSTRQFSLDLSHHLRLRQLLPLCNLLLLLLTNRNLTKIGDPTFQTLHLRLFLNAGRTDRPLVFRLKLLRTYDEGSLMAQEFHENVYRDS
ncbi:hypothetical protein Tco_1197946 [Tanacetum coccineum]